MRKTGGFLAIALGMGLVVGGYQETDAGRRGKSAHGLFEQLEPRPDHEEEARWQEKKEEQEKRIEAKRQEERKKKAEDLKDQGKLR